MNNLKFVSASQLEKFEQCPKQWWAHYIRKVVEPPPSPSLNLGNAVHKVLELVLKAYKTNNDKYKDPNVLIPLVKKKWPVNSETDKLVNELVFNAIEMGWLQNVKYCVDTEKELKFELPECNVNIIGRMDRLDILGQEYIKIIDLKTSKHVPSMKDLRLAWQTRIYSIPFLQQQNKYIEVEYWYLRQKHRGKKCILIKNEDYEPFRDKLIKTVNKMKECDGSIITENPLCRWCLIYKECKGSKIKDETIQAL